MKHKGTIVTYVCPDCEKEMDCYVSPYDPGNISGPPENCYPPEGGEIDEYECKHCGRQFTDNDFDAIFESSQDNQPDQEDL